MSRNFEQSDSAKQWMADLERKKKEQLDYMNSEEYKRKMWESQQDQWEKKAKKEGWHYERKPYVSESQVQAQKEQDRQNKIASLKAELRELLTAEENDALLAKLKAEQV